MYGHNFGLLVSALLFFSACSSKPTAHQEQAAPLGPDEFVLVATSDFHAALDRAEGLAEVLRGLKKQYGEHMLYLDAGDQFQGSLEGNLSKGKSIVELFNALPLDAAAIGNHDLDYDNFKTRVREAKYPWLSVNFINKSTGKPAFATHAVFQRSRKICVIGATTPGTTFITNPRFIKGLRFDPLEKRIEQEARRLRGNEHCDAVILTAHAGLDCDIPPNPDTITRCLREDDRAEILRLLQALPRGTLDAVIAGHTHFRAQETINGTPALEAGANGKFVGMLHLRLRNGSKPGEFKFDPFIKVPEKPRDASSVADITRLLEPYRAEAAKIKSRPVGTAAGKFTHVYQNENALGNLVAQALLDKARELVPATAFAITNSGGIRADLPAGALTYGDVYKVMPFDNGLAIIDLTGAELHLLLEIALSGGHGSSAVAGLKIKRLDVAPGQHGIWDRDLDGNGKKEDWERNLIVQILDENGKRIEDHRHYKVATLDFLAIGGDHQIFFYKRIPSLRKKFFPEVLARDAIAERLQKTGVNRPEEYFSAQKKNIELVALPL